MDEVAGIILAGGQSRRFGSPKAFAKRGNLPFYQYSIDALKSHTSTILLVTSPILSESFEQIDSSVHVITDQVYQGNGPLAGIYTGMDKQEANWYIVVPIDVPFIQAAIIKQLIDQIDYTKEAIVPIVKGKMQPLLALYRGSIKEIILDQLDHSQRSMQQLHDRINVKYVKMNDEMPFININRQEDYANFINRKDGNTRK
ncbi:molybdenum cofactor guanylyltransferase [Aquibacillus koreensis]|uniref:Probable molybdenum cofactor guanylyltransferase n=1 Tax=Aquibacillus koreensis TaxID=279446 RepID=A0A9X3WN43_9BACI|nr:molybdenum cofactor guanylyltransferase [Aquibacillus koreensis]MCT2535888.1 molybdenum cofactor guanylyltransferase [Aquibacillus koreensis]MDC3420344.1 molybdenum cofactor guanylyltransferase [Aquibacillus koreensis]